MPESSRRKKIIENTSIAEVIRSYFPLQHDGLGFRSLCPFHDDHLSTFRVDPAMKSFKCSDCGTSGDVVDFVRYHEDITVTKALDLLEACA